MKKTALISAAVGGLLLGATATSLTSCSADDAPASTTENANLPKHACKGLNDCKNQGGCKGADNSCKGNNECKGQGGCATVAHHSCKGQNTCKGLGGCGSGDNGCKAKNSCEGKGGCGVPIKH
ncbi:MAG: hypothetical protein AB7O97_17150 [Planctomycetota bacterium]